MACPGPSSEEQLVLGAGTEPGGDGWDAAVPATPSSPGHPRAWARAHTAPFPLPQHKRRLGGSYRGAGMRGGKECKITQSPSGHRGAGTALPSGTSTAGPRQEKRNQTLQSSALVCPEQDHKPTTSAHPLHPPAPLRVPPEPQGRHHTGFPLCNPQPGRAPGGFYTPQLQISESRSSLEM